MVRADVPLKWPRFFVYQLTSALAVISGSAALNSFVKANQDRTHAKHLVAAEPGDFTLTVNLDDIVRAGIFLNVGEILLGSLAFVSSILLFLRPDSKSKSGGQKGYTVANTLWAFLSVWTLASAIVVLDFGKNRSAKVAAYNAGVKLPDSIIALLQKQLGQDPAYWGHFYTRFLAISPFPLVVFSFASLALTLIAQKRAKARQAHYAAPTTTATAVRDDDGSFNAEKGEKQYAENTNTV